MVTDRLLRADETAVILDVSLQRLYALAREGRIPSVRIGRQLRFDPNTIAAFINAGGAPLPGIWRREPQSNGADL